MEVMIWTKGQRAKVAVEKIVRVNRRSVRFDLGNGKMLTVKKDDIISIREDGET